MRGILGIDPGVGGALALYDPTLSIASGLRWQVIDMPVVGETKHELNAGALRDWLQRFSPECAFLELVTPMPSIPGGDGKRRGMGAASAFRFGGMYFGVKAVLACCNIPVTPVVPTVWKRAQGLLKSDKEASRRRALQLFPDQGSLLARKKDENRAEAMLIADYGRQRLGLLAA